MRRFSTSTGPVRAPVLAGRDLGVTGAAGGGAEGGATCAEQVTSEPMAAIVRKTNVDTLR
ncbi:MAG: hypothetical protein H0W28_03485 [Pyrinomonadaceae bacterium]|nr:hypothetical protein [Pyrinomonadaceae bacterium]